MTKVIGIDLGTTNSVVGYLENGRIEIIPNSEGAKTTPSVVFYNETGEKIAGELAKRQRLVKPDRTIYSVKRFVGQRWDECEDRRRGIPFKLVANDENMTCIEIHGEYFLPEEVQAETLLKMKQTAEDFLGEEVTQAVITCPAYFNDSQRSATKKAAELAGLEALRIINEPTAAALAFGLDRREYSKVAVFDLGGGTFDISILEIDDDVFEVKASCGDTFLGGDVIDQVIQDWLLERVLEESGLDLKEDSQAVARINEAAEKVKCELSTLDKTTFSLPFLAAGETGPYHFESEITREMFETMIAPLLERLVAPCRQAMSDAGLNKEDLDQVILVGGSTRIPAVQRLAAKIFETEIDKSINPDEAVAMGAAIQGGIMTGDLDEILLLDVTPLSLGIELAGGIFSALIERNSSIPTTANKRFTTVRDNQKTVKIHVLQGERKIAIENRTLARFVLEGIEPAPREVPEIEVTFTIDANGILNVSAMDLTSGTVKQVTVESYQPSKDLSTDKLLEEAEAKRQEDSFFMRKAQVRQKLDELRQDLIQYIAQASRSDSGNIEKDERRIREGIFRLEIALSQDKWENIEAGIRELKTLHTELAMGGAFGPKGLKDAALDSDLEMHIETMSSKATVHDAEEDEKKEEKS